MATGTDIPLTVSDEAAALIAEWGMQREFEQMVEHTRQTVPGLKSIAAIADFGPCGDDPGVILCSLRADPGPGHDRTDWDWGSWQIATFPPQVCIRFTMLSGYEAS